MTDILIKNLPILVVLCPLMMSLFVVLISNAFISWILTLLTTVLTFILSILLFQEVQIQTYISYALGNWAPPLGIEYLIDKVSIIPIIINIMFLVFFFILIVDNEGIYSP